LGIGVVHGDRVVFSRLGGDEDLAGDAQVVDVSAPVVHVHAEEVDPCRRSDHGDGTVSVYAQEGFEQGSGCALPGFEEFGIVAVEASESPFQVGVGASEACYVLGGFFQGRSSQKNSYRRDAETAENFKTLS